MKYYTGFIGFISIIVITGFVSCFSISVFSNSLIFQRDVYPILIKYEGSSYTNNPKDPGGPTKCGWTLKSYRDMVNSKASVRDIKTLNCNRAALLYEKYFWIPYGSSRILNRNVSIAVLLAQVNLGPTRPNKLLQRMTNYLCDYHLKVDGVIGTKSIEAINNCDHLWPGFPYILFHYYATNPQITPVMQWASRGLRRRVLHNVQPY